MSLSSVEVMPFLARRARSAERLMALLAQSRTVPIGVRKARPAVTFFGAVCWNGFRVAATDFSASKATLSPLFAMALASAVSCRTALSELLPTSA